MVNLLKDGAISAHRISMVESGHALKGDLLVQSKWKAEVKGGAQVPKFLYKARKDGEEILFMRRDREKWLVCMDLEWFIENLADKTELENHPLKNSDPEEEN